MPLASCPEAPPKLRAKVLREGEHRSSSTRLRAVDPNSHRLGAWSPHGVLNRMAAAFEGERNHVLFWCACALRRDWFAGRCDDDELTEALDALEIVAADTGLGGDEINRTVESARKAVLEEAG